MATWMRAVLLVACLSLLATCKPVESEFYDTEVDNSSEVEVKEETASERSAISEDRAEQSGSGRSAISQDGAEEGGSGRSAISQHGAEEDGSGRSAITKEDEDTSEASRKSDDKQAAAETEESKEKSEAKAVKEADAVAEKQHSTEETGAVKSKVKKGKKKQFIGGCGTAGCVGCPGCIGCKRPCLHHVDNTHGAINHVEPPIHHHHPHVHHHHHHQPCHPSCQTHANTVPVSHGVVGLPVWNVHG